MEKLDINKPKSQKGNFFSTKLIIGITFALVLGGLTGYFLTQNPSQMDSVSNKIKSTTISKGTVEGSGDTSIFKDTAEGVLKEGGINGEGAYHLERPGGESQNVYLTSSTVDLGKYEARKVKVWGQTNKGQYAGWLMDVGKIEVLE